jgi:hypothetical protein
MIAVGHKQCHKISGSQTVSPKSADTFIWTKDPLITNGVLKNQLLLFHKWWIDVSHKQYLRNLLLLFHKWWIDVNHKRYLRNLLILLFEQRIRWLQTVSPKICCYFFTNGESMNLRWSQTVFQNLLLLFHKRWIDDVSKNCCFFTNGESITRWFQTVFQKLLNFLCTRSSNGVSKTSAITLTVFQNLLLLYLNKR